jgi:hypothetical protein
MKNLQKGFIIPLVIIIIAILAIGGGAYVYTNQVGSTPQQGAISATSTVATTTGSMPSQPKPAPYASSTPISNKNGPETMPADNGKCPEGYVYYGNPLGCVKPDYYNDCHTNPNSNCPKCLSVGTLINTPTGSVAVEDLKVGMKVWTVNSKGEKTEAAIAKVGKTLVPDPDYITHIALADGRKVIVSPSHPTADGKSIGTLKIGDMLDGSKIVSTSLEKYASAYTYDLLPAGETGTYWANGILIGSTLK